MIFLVIQDISMQSPGIVSHRIASQPLLSGVNVEKMKANMGVTVAFPIFMNPVFLIARGGSDLRISRASTKRQHHINHDKNATTLNGFKGLRVQKATKMRQKRRRVRFQKVFML